MIWFDLSAAAMGATALFHSLLGERRLVRPLLALDQGVAANALARRIFRFAWHATSVLMLLSAVTIAWPGVPRGVAIAIGAGWFATGLVNAVYMRGRHIAWVLLTLSGALALIGAAA